MCSFNPPSFTVAYHTLHIYPLYGLSLIVKVCALAACSHLEVCVSIRSAVMRQMKWPTTYTRYFALWIQLLPAPQSHLFFPLGVRLCLKKGLLSVQLAHSTISIGWFNISTSYWLKVTKLQEVSSTCRKARIFLFAYLHLFLLKISSPKLWLHHHLTSSLIPIWQGR